MTGDFGEMVLLIIVACLVLVVLVALIGIAYDLSGWWGRRAHR